MPCAWDWQFGDKLHDRDRRGEEPECGALASEESSLVARVNR